MPNVFRRGIGVSNVHERLRVLFGNEFHMLIEPRPGGGTVVRIQIPELQDPSAPEFFERRAADTPMSSEVSSSSTAPAWHPE
jgi:hypothetical protein